MCQGSGGDGDAVPTGPVFGRGSIPCSGPHLCKGSELASKAFAIAWEVISEEMSTVVYVRIGEISEEVSSIRRSE